MSTKQGKDQVKSIQLDSRKLLLYFILMFVIGGVIFGFLEKYVVDLLSYVVDQTAASQIGLPVLSIISTQLVVVVLFARDKLNSAAVICFLMIFWTIIAFKNLYSTAGGALDATVLIMCVLPLILLSVAPAKTISRRLIFLALGLLLFIALNGLSKLGLNVTAPKLQG